MSFRVDGRSLDRIALRYADAALLVEDELEDTGNRAIDLLQPAMVSEAPVDIGTLQENVYAETQRISRGFRLIGGSRVPYDIHVRRGRRPGSRPPPSASLVGWVTRHGMPASAAFVVARAIGRRGIPANDYVGRAMDAVRDKIRADLHLLPKRVIARAKTLR